MKKTHLFGQMCFMCVCVYSLHKCPFVVFSLVVVFSINVAVPKRRAKESLEIVVEHSGLAPFFMRI